MGTLAKALGVWVFSGAQRHLLRPRWLGTALGNSSFLAFSLFRKITLLWGI